MAETSVVKGRASPLNAAEVAAEEIPVRVARELGDEAAASFREATAATAAGRVEGGGAEAGAAAAAALSTASERFVSILKAADERSFDTGAGYAEVLLGYARCLMVYVRREGGRAQVFGEGVAEGMTAAGKVLAPQKRIDVEAGDEATNVLAADDAEVVKEEDADGDDDDDDEEVEEVKVENEEGDVAAGKDGGRSVSRLEKKDGQETLAAVMQIMGDAAAKNGGTGDSEQEEESTDELCWDALEVARTIFASLGPAYDSRLSAVHELLADYLSETDAEGERVAAEYSLAADAEQRAHGLASRSVANCRYMQFLALRRERPDASLGAMARAIESFRAVADAADGGDADRETVSMLEGELREFKAALDAHTLKKKGAALGSTVGFAKTMAPPARGGGGGPSAAGPAACAGQGGEEEVVAVRAVVQPVAVTVQPRRRRATPVSVVPTDAEIEAGVVGGEQPAAKKRKV